MAKGRFPMGGLPGGGMNNMLKQAQKMQENIIKAQEEFEQKTFNISAGGGAVKITANGKMEILELKISKEVIDPDDVEMLEDLIISAVNETIKQIEKEKNDNISKIAGPLGGLI